MKYDLGRAAIEARQCQDLLSQVVSTSNTIQDLFYFLGTHIFVDPIFC